MPIKRIFTVLALAGVTAGAAGQEGSLDELRATVLALQAEVAQLRAEAGAAERLRELERRIDLLAAELEKARAGSVPQEPQPSPGLAPAAAKVYAAPPGVSIGGYGELLYENFSSRRQDGAVSGRGDRIDFLRNVVYVGYKFGDKILFNSEIEIEHATTGEGAEDKGEVSLEFGYLDFRPWKRVGLRAGLLLVPVGFINEMHEAPVFLGARRPQVETSIVPATWRDNGIGVYGETGPLQWRGYLMAGLSSAGFSASGIRDGRQGGSRSLASNLAFTGRLDFTGVPGLLAGVSLFSGGSAQGALAGGARFRGRVSLFEAHAQYERRGLRLRALGALTRVGDAALINASNGLSGADSVGERQHGWYVQAGYDVLALRPAGRWSAVPFLRYESLDTQARVPAGFARRPASRVSSLTAGIAVKPNPHVVFKADFQRLRNGARTGANQLNLAAGYLF